MSSSATNAIVDDLGSAARLDSLFEHEEML